MVIVSDTYTRGGIPQSRYCSTCAHYQALSGSSSGGNSGGSARVCLYILDTGHRRGCEQGLGAAVLKDRRRRARSRKKAKP